MGGLDVFLLPTLQSRIVYECSFARFGIIALVDEATGYQDDRARHDLHRIFEQYVSKELAFPKVDTPGSSSTSKASVPC